MIVNSFYLFPLSTLFLVGFILLLWKWKSQKMTPVPPGPDWISILYWLYGSFKKSQIPSTALKNLAEIYGDVMTLNIGNVKSVIFSSHESIQGILKSDYSLDRAMVPVMKDRNMNQNLGLIWTSGDIWDTTRRFTLRHLRDFGYSKTKSMDAVVNEECSKFLHHFRHLIQKNSNQVVNMDGVFQLPFLNNLWRFVIGKSYAYNDPEIRRLLKLHSEFFRSTNLIFDPIFPPFVRNWFPKWTGKTKQMESIANIYKFAQETLNEHKEYVKQNSDPRGFLDVFVQAQEDPRNTFKNAFTDENCIVSLLDLLIAGTDTSSNTMSFGILYMILNPKIQAKVHAEIDSKIDKDQPIVLQMRDILPYTHATLLEILRNGIVLRVPSPRQATQDFYFKNYFIKKGTFLIINLEASHFSKRTWGDPENFRPGRFLDKNETKIDAKVVELLDAFGAGKRVCIGQSIAEASLFIFFVNLMRSFQFVQIEGQPKPNKEPCPGSIYTPRAYHVKVTERL